MFKSKVVAYVMPSSSCNVVLILGIGYGLRTMRLLSSLKSDIVRTVWSFLGIMKEGEAHLDNGCHFNTPIAISRSISFMRVSLCTFGIGYGLPWYGLAPSFNSIEKGSNFQSPSVPSKALRIWGAVWVANSGVACSGACNCSWQCLEGLLCHI